MGCDTGPPTLEASYAICRRLNKLHGTTYYLSTKLLPQVKRHHVWALYGFCRYADDIVDDLGPASDEERAAALAQLSAECEQVLNGAPTVQPVLVALAHTVRAFDLDPDLFVRFLSSMRADLTITSYQTWDDLLGYMDGSAAVIGEMMIPILEPTSPAATRHARDLGFAFQLTNFLRDVGEDLQRGRVYLPQEDLQRFSADPHTRTVDGAWVELMKFEIDRCRELYRSADAGIGMLRGASARCVSAARTLYSEILDRIEFNAYDVFSKRARVPRVRKLAVAAGALRR